MSNILPTIVVVLSSAMVTPMENFGYSECNYNSYKAVCMGNYELMNRENRGLIEFPAISRGVTCVKLRQNAITHFPDDTNVLNEIVTLDLAVNRISSLPTEMDKMSKLEILDVSENRLEILSPNVRFPISLRGLLLGNNRMKTIPPGVKIPGLFVLDLSNNEFTDVPVHFCVSDQLIRVDFTSNPLRDGVAGHVETAGQCKNANEVPFCLFTDSASIKCDCSTVGPILGGTSSFCLGTPRRSQELKCTTDSEAQYKGKSLFDVNATMVQHACPLKTSSSENGAKKIVPEISIHIGIVLLFCLLLS